MLKPGGKQDLFCGHALERKGWEDIFKKWSYKFRRHLFSLENQTLQNKNILGKCVRRRLSFNPRKCTSDIVRRNTLFFSKGAERVIQRTTMQISGQLLVHNTHTHCARTPTTPPHTTHNPRSNSHQFPNRSCGNGCLVLSAMVTAFLCHNWVNCTFFGRQSPQKRTSISTTRLHANSDLQFIMTHHEPKQNRDMNHCLRNTEERKWVCVWSGYSVRVLCRVCELCAVCVVCCVVCVCVSVGVSCRRSGTGERGVACVGESGRRKDGESRVLLRGVVKW